MPIKTVSDFKVIQNNALSDDVFLLVLKSEVPLLPISSGQFVEVLIKQTDGVFLRRPFSIHDVDYEQNTLTLYIKKNGKGTEALSRIKQGFLNLIWPLGKGFTILKNKKVLLVGGGCGIAPLKLLAKELLKASCDLHILLAAQSESSILMQETYGSLGTLYFTTDDGSLGCKGVATAHPILNERLSQFDAVYCCGPEIMMQGVARLASKHNVFCEVSLENTMACGIGACLCCVVDTTSGHKCVCTEGPVFNIKDLKWPI